jgi:sugar-specific transcriptional regulator TrmB
MSGKYHHTMLYSNILEILTMYSEILAKLDLAKNEAILYESLLRLGEASAGTLALKSKVHRRNVYDSLNRLMEKGLVFEVHEGREIRYQPVEPNKLLEKIDEKRVMLEKILPDLQRMYQNEAHQEDVYIYKGLEGWKNYLRDILKVGEDVYTIGGKGAWTDPRIKTFFEMFKKEADKQSIKFKILFDQEVKTSKSKILTKLKSDYRFLPKTYSSDAAIDVYGDRVVITAHTGTDTIDENASFTVIINKAIADAFRIWFAALWELGDKK